MRFTSEQRLDDGVLERGFTLGEIPGILWTPGSASGPAPLILLGHPGGLHKMYPRLVARARHSAAAGLPAAHPELPGHAARRGESRPRGPQAPPRGVEPPPGGARAGGPAPTCAGRWSPASRPATTS